MQRKTFEEMNCSVAHCVDVIGEWWTPLLLRDMFLGVSRFDEFQSRLGIARNILAERLNRLVETGVVEKRRYQERPERFEYRLTEKGGDLWRVLTAMREWGDRWAAPQGPSVQVVHRRCGHVTTSVMVCAECGEELERRDLQLVRGPGARDDSIVPVRVAEPSG
jgi:DNA-binding HxlR family transcriptional regulator